jgi:protein-tyrosine kinase
MSRIFEALQRSESGQYGGALEDPALVNELLEAAERDADHVLEATEGLPTLTVSPRANSRLVALTDKESLAAEKFRFLAVRLRQMQQTRTLKKLLITSTLPEEGKSMVSANLAATLARRQRQKVLLIEGDLRRPVLARLLGLGGIPGLAEWLQQSEGLEGFGEIDHQEPDPGEIRGDGRPAAPLGNQGRPLGEIYRLQGAGFWFLPAGEPPENLLELLQSERMNDLMNHLAARFDWIIVDSPPLLPVADASVWSRLADGMLLVVREGKTEKRQLQRALASVDASNVLGVVINSCSTADEKHYYARYHKTRPGAGKS